jgi:integrase
MLTDTKIRQTKPGPNGLKLQDGDGLHLWVAPTGTKSWRWRYQRAGKERLMTLGQYPAMTLAQSRARRDSLRDELTRTGAGTPLTFKAASEGWLAKQAPLWKPHHAADVRGTLAAEIWPAIGDKPLSAIEAPELVRLLAAVQRRGAVELAHRLRQRIEAVYAYAAAIGAARFNPAAGLAKALAPVVRQGRRPAVLDLAEARAVLAQVEGTPAHPVTLLAHRLLALTALRPGEVRFGRWGELVGLGTEAPAWRVPAARMKHKTAQLADMDDHIIPLARQAVEVIEVLRRFSGASEWLFPSWSDSRRPFSENALVYLLNRAGLSGQQVPHGWRATFSTVMNERFPADRQVIDLMLAHAPKDAVEAAYNRARHMERRRELAQLWADLLLEGARPIADLLALPRR